MGYRSIGDMALLLAGGLVTACVWCSDLPNPTKQEEHTSSLNIWHTDPTTSRFNQSKAVC